MNSSTKARVASVATTVYVVVALGGYRPACVVSPVGTATALGQIRPRPIISRTIGPPCESSPIFSRTVSRTSVGFGNSVESSVELARRAWTRLDYKAALDTLDRARSDFRETPPLLAAYGSVYLKAEEPSRARQYLDRAIKLDGGCAEAMLGEAEASLLEHNYAAAEDWLHRLLTRNPADNKNASSGHVLMARVRLEIGDRVEAEAEAARAIQADPENAHALYIMAFLRAAQRKPAQVRSLAQRALEIDPYLAGARRLLSQYLNGSAGYSQKVDAVAMHHFEAGKALEAQGRIGEALSEYEAAASAEPGYYRALIALAGLNLMQREYNKAVAAASRALEVDPEGAIANMEIAYAQIGLGEQSRTEIGATDYSLRFYQDRLEPVKSSLLRLVFPDYDKLSDKGRFVLGKSVSGLASFLPGLASVSARHYLLRIDQSVSECAGFKELRDRTTFDGRYYASIRGVGGRIALSGIEYLDEASRGGFNAIAHEFAHQVHETAMSLEDQNAIRRLYATAVREGRALDYYAAANEFEYFATGYEAFVSGFKRPGATLTARHTRDELRARDPGLFSLLAKMADKSAQGGAD